MRQDGFFWVRVEPDRWMPAWRDRGEWWWIGSEESSRDSEISDDEIGPRIVWPGGAV